MISNSGILPSAPNLFYALVYFQGKISELTTAADIWLIPSKKLSESTQHVINKNGKTVYVRFSLISKSYHDYKNTFEALNNYLTTH
jgi:transcriptional regulator NrdR family protein